MAQPFTRGAVHIFVGATGSGPAGSSGFGPVSPTPIYLGTGERAPRVSIRKRFRDVQNDLGGDEPFDFSYQGRSAIVIVKLTRWNELVLQALETVVGVQPGLDAGGTDVAGDIGTLMITQGAAVPLWISYSYAPAGVAPQAAFSNLRNGWHFFAAWLEGPDDHEGGTDPATEALVFRCARVFNPLTGAFLLYDRNMAGLPAPT